jgi:hypothetical protein
MRTFKFYKEADNRWYAELPEWEGSKAELEMVLGADTMLEYMAEGNNSVFVCISEKEFEGADKLEFIRLAKEFDNGAHYKLNKYRGIDINLKVWLCDVLKFVYNSFPNALYVSAVD